MRTRMTLTALCAAALLMTACGRNKSDPPMPYVAPVTVDVGMAPATGSVSSVPSAASVLTSATGTAQAASAARSNEKLTRAEESTAMPIAGQNNDHSAPVAAGKSASSPQ